MEIVLYCAAQASKYRTSERCRERERGGGVNIILHLLARVSWLHISIYFKMFI